MYLVSKVPDTPAPRYMYVVCANLIELLDSVTAFEINHPP